MAAATEDVVMPPPDEGGSTPTRSRTPARVRARRRRPTLPALATAALLLVCASLDPSGGGAGYPAAGSVLPIFALAANPSSAPAPSIAGGGEDEGHVAAPAPVVARLGRKLGVRYRPTSHSASAASIPRGGAGDRGKAPSSSSSDKTLSEILGHAVHRGLGGGLPGAVAGIVQVLTLMWLRTVINYQCRYGTTFLQSLTTLYNQGGVPRFYRGMAFALVQAPLARFASTAANDGVEALLGNLEYTKNWGPGKGTVVASAVVGLWRMMLMPVDTCKTVLQVDSAEGFRNLIRGVRRGKVWLLYQGAMAQALSAVVSHYPWFYTYNYLTKHPFVQRILRPALLRNAVVGFLSSVVSDTVSNAVRVIKTTKQAMGSKHVITYGEAVGMILAADGWRGLFGRGLKTRIFANALQSVVFTVIWRGLAERWSNSQEQADKGVPSKKGEHTRNQNVDNEDDDNE
eukprot:CAMPEP_0113540572 /NCGR_PEP_ID=MMETSP0015_2-20120614/8554_1 /TAXON_ID=2838 /ORGANISM="Odontella" /LENGTH=456 /DNA_ID=CAMNT_0000440389 /DNA_START=113 /DNA_END=1483 /DNA_ORIENTATION=- /assembly_acc=CAM_ASM_000160